MKTVIHGQIEYEHGDEMKKNSVDVETMVDAGATLHLYLEGKHVTIPAIEMMQSLLIMGIRPLEPWNK